MGLEGKVAVITGGARGIGRAIGLRLAADGADIGIIDLSREAAEATARRGAGARAAARRWPRPTSPTTTQTKAAVDVAARRPRRGRHPHQQRRHRQVGVLRQHPARTVAEADRRQLRGLPERDPCLPALPDRARAAPSSAWARDAGPGGQLGRGRLLRHQSGHHGELQGARPRTGPLPGPRQLRRPRPGADRPAGRPARRREGRPDHGGGGQDDPHAPHRRARGRRQRGGLPGGRRLRLPRPARSSASTAA